jgi:4'-phosphopantetheinyl transferase
MTNADISLHPWLQLWFAKVNDATLAAEQNVRAWLSVEEHDRWQRIRSVRKSREFLLSRAMMRHALCRQFGRAEPDWQFSAQSGPPQVANLPADIYLSLSHSRGYVCFALSNSTVGVDIEVIQPRRNLSGVAEMFMDATELAQFTASEAHGLDYLLRCWCAKEAGYKALGPVAQATTVLRSIQYAQLRSGRDGWSLLEGAGEQLRFAAVTAQSPRQVEQYSYIVPVTVELGGMIHSTISL